MRRGGYRGRDESNACPDFRRPSETRRRYEPITPPDFREDSGPLGVEVRVTFFGGHIFLRETPFRETF